MRIASSIAVVATLAAAALTAASKQQTPTDWTWRTDAPATLGGPDAVGPAAWHYVTMAPGWHITTGPGALLYPAADNRARGNFRIEAEIFLFPGTDQQEYGIFIGGDGLEPSSKSPTWLAFVVRRDGRAALLQSGPSGIAPVRDWTTADGVVPHPGGKDETARNRIFVDVGPKELAFGANGKTAVTLPRAGAHTDGVFGLRIGAGLNLHVSAFDVTRRLAPR